MLRRSFLIVLVMGLLTTGIAWAGSSKITITAPQITGTIVDAATTQAIQTVFNNLANQMADNLNTQYFSKLHDLNDLTRGFANSNAAASNNASFMGFQNYDIFTFMLGSNLGVTVPSLNPNEISNLGASIRDNGDVYSGISTGGVAGQLGINTSSFLLKNLYLSVKFGIFNYKQTSGAGASKVDFNYQQFMVGLGANYRLMNPWDFGMGLLRWRGLSLGSGLTVNSNNVDITLGYPDQLIANQAVNGTTFTVDTKITNIQSTLKVSSTSLTIPVELDTSVQILYLLNFGMGLGVDINLPFSTLKLAGGADANFTLKNSGVTVPVSMSPGSVSITGTDSKNNMQFFDIFAPRISTDVGLNIFLFRLDVPMSFYPVTKTFTIGIVGGISW